MEEIKEIEWGYLDTILRARLKIKTKFSNRNLINNNIVADIFIEATRLSGFYKVAFYGKFRALNDSFPKDLDSNKITIQEAKQMIEKFLFKYEKIKVFL